MTKLIEYIDDLDSSICEDLENLERKVNEVTKRSYGEAAVACKVLRDSLRLSFEILIKFEVAGWLDDND